MGAVPHSGPGEDYSGVYSALEALANVMINLIGGYVSYAWAVAGPFIDDLISAIDTENLESEKLTCQFDYPREETGDYNWPADCGCWYWWEIRVKPSQTIKFKIYEYHLGVENAWDAWAVEHSWTPTINSPPNPDGMSVAEMRKYGIEEIPVSKIKKRADELGLSECSEQICLPLGVNSIGERGVNSKLMLIFTMVAISMVIFGIGVNRLDYSHETNMPDIEGIEKQVEYLRNIQMEANGVFMENENAQKLINGKEYLKVLEMIHNES